MITPRSGIRRPESSDGFDVNMDEWGWGGGGWVKALILKVFFLRLTCSRGSRFAGLSLPGPSEFSGMGGLGPEAVGISTCHAHQLAGDGQTETRARALSRS